MPSNQPSHSPGEAGKGAPEVALAPPARMAVRDARSSWRFPGTFWIANLTELFERAAYYGTFIAARTYLIRVVGLNDIQAGFVAGLFGAFIYLFPFFSGALADRLGFRASLILAFALLGAGYSSLGLFHTLGPVSLGLLLIVLGGSFVKPIISGTASRSSTELNRARAFSIFYMMVNIGSFVGKTAVAPIRIELGVADVPWFSAGASVLALLITVLFYRPAEGAGERPRNMRETLSFAGLLSGPAQPACRGAAAARGMAGRPGAEAGGLCARSLPLVRLCGSRSVVLPADAGLYRLDAGAGPAARFPGLLPRHQDRRHAVGIRSQAMGRGKAETGTRRNGDTAREK